MKDLQLMKKDMKKITIGIMLLLTLAMTACSDKYDFLGENSEYVANQVELYQSWQLIGYGSERFFHMIDEEFRKKSEQYGYRFYIVFKPDGTFEGRDAINGLDGSYSCNGNQLKIDRLGTTLIFDKNKDSREFGKRFQASTSYGIKEGKKLRLYYSKKEFLYFESFDRVYITPSSSSL